MPVAHLRIIVFMITVGQGRSYNLFSFSLTGIVAVWIMDWLAACPLSVSQLMMGGQWAEGVSRFLKTNFFALSIHMSAHVSIVLTR